MSDDNSIFVRRVLTEKNPFWVYTILTHTKLLVECYSKEHYIILSDFSEVLYVGRLVEKRICIKNEI